MALVYSDRTKDTSTTTGTGTYTLSNSAPTGFQTFGNGVGDGNTCQYTATDGTDWEVGLGTYTASGTTLARTLVQASSNSNNAVNWGAGTRTLWVDLPASIANNSAILSGVSNLGIASSVGSSALTVALKDGNGNDPTPRSPVIVPFRSATAATGNPSILTVTAATSIVISSGSTMGTANGVAFRLWLVAFNDAGTFRLGLVNALSGTNIMYLREGIFSSTAEGGAGGADSAQVIYTGSAVTSKAMTILGYLNFSSGEGTAGTWATNADVVQPYHQGAPLPGDIVQIQRTDTGASATGTTTIPLDDTIPQNTEGDQYMSLSITPSSAPNLLSVRVVGNVSNATQTYIGGALFRDSTASAVAAEQQFPQAGTRPAPLGFDYLALAASTSATTFKFRAGSSGSTCTFNGASGSRTYGGAMNSFMQIQEVVA